MPRMTPLEKRQWDDELSHAHRMWASQGLVADRIGSQGSDQRDIWMLLRGYRGDQWNAGWGGIPRQFLATTPLFFASVNRFQAGLLARNPRSQVLPRSAMGSEHARQVARDALVVEMLLDYDFDRGRFFYEWNGALFDSFFSPAGGFVRYGFTPAREYEGSDGERLETFHMAEPDKPWIQRVRPWDLRVDPMGMTLKPNQTARWVAFRNLRTMRQIEANPALKVRQDLRPNVRFEPMRPRGFRGKAPRAIEMVESWVVYTISPERKWFELCEGCEKPIRDPDDWPTVFDGYRDLPFDQLAFNEQADTPFVEPFAAAIWESVTERNKLRTLMEELVKRMRRILLVNDTAIHDDDRAKLFDGLGPDLVEFIRTTGDPRAAMVQFNAAGLAPELIALDQMLVDDVREAMGQSRFNRAQRENVESATEASFIEEGSAAMSGRNLHYMEDFLRSSVAHYAKARQQATFADEIVPLVGAQDAAVLQDNQGAPWLTATREQVRAEWDFTIRAGSTLPEDREREAQKATARLQVVASEPLMPFFNLGQWAEDWTIAQGKNPVVYNATPQALANTLGARQMGMDPLAQGGAQLGNPAETLRLLEGMRNSSNGGERQ